MCMRLSHISLATWFGERCFAVSSAPISTVSQDGKEFRFDTEAFRTILHLFEQIDFSGLRIPEEGQSVLYEYDMANVLFAMESTSMQSGMETLLLRLEEGDSPIWPVSLEVAFVNPIPPIRNRRSRFWQRRRRISATIRASNDAGRERAHPQCKLPGRAGKLRPADRGDGSAAGDRARQKSALSRSNWRPCANTGTITRASQYNVTAEQIAQYRQTAQFLVAKRYIGIEDTNSYIQQIAQYLTGALSAEELIRALDTTVAMMVQERMEVRYNYGWGSCSRCRPRRTRSRAKGAKRRRAMAEAGRMGLRTPAHTRRTAPVVVFGLEHHVCGAALLHRSPQRLVDDGEHLRYRLAFSFGYVLG